MVNSPTNALLKKGAKRGNAKAKTKDNATATSYSTGATKVDADVASSSPPMVSEAALSVIRHVAESPYQTDDLDAQDGLRKIAARRSSDLLPSKKGDVNLFERTHFGLLVNYACIGFLNGLLPTMVYPFFKLYLNMEGYQVSAAASIIMLPWSYKTFFGILSDHYPILGYRRKSYILIGWFVCFAALMILAFSPRVEPYFKPGELQRTRSVQLRAVQNENAPHAGARYLIQIMLVCLGYVITDVACDGIMVELAQHEHIEVRGSAQSTIYTTRFTGNLVGGIVAAICFNGREFGGSFHWSLTYETIFFGCAVIAMIGSVCTIFYLVEEEYFPELDRHPFREMWRIVKQRAIWQMMAFHFLNSFFNNFGFAGYTAVQEYWVGVEPLNNSMATCFSTFLFVAATVLMKRYFLNTSWRWLMFVCSVFSIVLNYIVTIAVTFDVMRNQWFYLGGPQLAVIPDGMRHVVSGFVTVEIAEHGFEGATYSLLTTVHNLASPFASTVSNLVDSQFAVTDDDIASDTSFVRGQVAICLSIAAVMQMLSLATLVLLPNQKLEAQELKFHGSSSRLAGVLALLIVLFALGWSTLVNLLSIQSSTACLVIAGGRGCT